MKKIYIISEISTWADHRRSDSSIETLAITEDAFTAYAYAIEAWLEKYIERVLEQGEELDSPFLYRIQSTVYSKNADDLEALHEEFVAYANQNWRNEYGGDISFSIQIEIQPLSQKKKSVILPDRYDEVKEDVGFDIKNLPLTSTGKIGKAGWQYIEACLSADVSTSMLAEILASYSATSSVQAQFTKFLAKFSPKEEKEESKEKIKEKITTEMVLIPAGEFWMGDEAQGSEKSQKVQISKDFYIGKYPVTQKLWRAVMGIQPSKFWGEDRPVENVSWFHCVEFCNKISELEGLEPVYTIDKLSPNKWNVSCDWKAKGYRLLTSAEWRYAARANQNTKYSGSDNPDEVAWYIRNARGGTHPVGLKKPNSWGLYDMSGNVSEWCWDWFEEGSGAEISSGEPLIDPLGATSGTKRVLRGGHFDSQAGAVAINNYVGSRTPGYTLDVIGLRLARSV